MSRLRGHIEPESLSTPCPPCTPRREARETPPELKLFTACTLQQAASPAEWSGWCKVQWEETRPLDVGLSGSVSRLLSWLVMTMVKGIHHGVTSVEYRVPVNNY